MSVVKLKEVSIIGKIKDIDEIATALGRTEAFHVDNAMTRYEDAPDVTTYSEENPYSEPLQSLTDVAQRLGLNLTLLKNTTGIRMSKDELISYTNELCSKLNGYVKEKQVAQDKLAKLSDASGGIEHFVGLNLNLDEIAKLEYVVTRFGSLTKENYAKLNAYESNPNVVFTPCTADAENQYGIYIAPIDGISEADRIFNGLKFRRITIDNMHGTPEETIAQLSKEREEQTAIIRNADSQIQAIWNSQLQKIREIYTLLTEKNMYFTAICRNAAKYDDNFILIGWIPKQVESRVKQDLMGYELSEFTIRGGKEVAKYNPPTAVKNVGPLKWFEFFVNLYGQPSQGEFDPTWFVGITYTLCFGIMFGDLGQGIGVAIVGALMGFCAKMPIGKVLIPCGICSAIFGFFYGSVFGFETWLNPIHQAMGIASPAGENHKLIEVISPSVSSWLVYGTIGLGVILIVYAMILGIINGFKKGDVENAVFGPSGICGVALFIGVAGVLATILLGDAMPLNLMQWWWFVFLLGIPVVLIFFKEILGAWIVGKKPHVHGGVGGFIAQNFFELFDVFIAYFSNALSFLRVGAFVLVHAGMMLVVFTLADMAAGIPVVYVIIVIIGNAVITGLECLLVCIQVLRLEFYELFSRYYTGMGRKYTPVSVKDALKN